MARDSEQRGDRPAHPAPPAPHGERDRDHHRQRDPDRHGDRGRDLEWPHPEGPGPEKLVDDYPLGRFQAERTDYFLRIVLRYAFGDTGNRPLPSGTNFWESPDVWVVSSAGWNVPVAGEPNHLFARVTNRGKMDAPDVRVRFWWANPSLAITETNAHEIGKDEPPIMVPLVPAHSSVVVECPYPWTPTIENQGHECVLAEAAPLYGDPITAPLDPVNDRHVCQKNLHVIAVEAGQHFDFRIGVANVSTLAQPVAVHMRTLSGQEVHAGLTAPALGGRTRVLATEQRLPLRMALARTGEFLAAPSALYPRRLLASVQAAARGRAQDCRPLGVVQHNATLEAGEIGTLRLRGTVPSDARPNQAFGFEFVQRMGDVVTGGYTVYVVVAGEQEPRGRNRLHI